MMSIIQIGHRLPQRLDPRSRPILSPRNTHVNGLRSLKTPLNVIFDFRSPLAKIRPFGWIVEEAVLIGSLGAPDYAGGGAGGIETSVWAVAGVGFAELAMDVRAEFTRS